jgi:hypothetical protein
MEQLPRESYSSLSVERLLEEWKERAVVDRRQARLERSKFAEWEIWKLVRISWR